MPGRTEHWDSVYASKSDAELSWTQSVPNVSLALIGEACPSSRPSRRVLDVGGGTSALAGCLLDRGCSVAVLDISQSALHRAQQKLGGRAGEVEWIHADIAANPSLRRFDVWHDRAVFHFFTEPADRAAYREVLLRTVPPGGHAIIATFAPDGPQRCSGLEVRQYDAKQLSAELGGRFQLLKTVPEVHATPWGHPQSFQYSLFRSISP